MLPTKPSLTQVSIGSDDLASLCCPDARPVTALSVCEVVKRTARDPMVLVLLSLSQLLVTPTARGRLGRCFYAWCQVALPYPRGCDTPASPPPSTRPFPASGEIMLILPSLCLPPHPWSWTGIPRRLMVICVSLSGLPSCKAICVASVREDLHSCLTMISFQP